MLERAISKTEWTRVRFDQIATQINDRVDNPAEAGVERYVGLEHLDPDSLRIRRWGEPTDVESTKLRFQPGDIIFGKRRVYQRKVAVADFEGICSAHAMVLRAKAGAVLPEFLPFFMQSDLFMERALSISVGSLSPTINWKALAAEEFLLPPLQEQARSVEASLGIEGAIDAYRNKIETLKLLRSSFLNDHFLPRLKSGVPLKTVVTLKAGGTPSRSSESFWGGNLPWASGKDLKVRLLSDTEERLTSEGWRAAKIAPAGATLIVVRGMILAHTFPVSVAAVPMAFNQDLRALVAGKSIRPAYLTAWAEWMGPWFLSRTAESSHGTKRLESQTIELALIPVVDHSAQDRFIRDDEKILAETRAASDRLHAVGELKKRFLNGLAGVA
ncbi:restriction endonuclease subunit S [Rhizobium bangladeshense]|uniref:restriction endonuclease subunit S n=1 Tax=Rhizobium bangladeshense TaxID=1138189 RepID=UPI001A9809CA|nr:restriction endonuclease subunit S [Rhizobium bangladeshense]QSY95927.1 restriction endonuclease subunit S [Rhizobium bangladeshense]